MISLKAILTFALAAVAALFLCLVPASAPPKGGAAGRGAATAGPVGRAAGAETTPNLKAGILTYSRSKGLFAGLSLKGVAITPDNDLNEAFYGKKAAELIASQADTPVPTQVRAFPLALARY